MSYEKNGSCNIPQKSPIKTPKRLLPLVEEGLVDAVVRQLMSGKEAVVFVVRCGQDIRCAKVYKEPEKRAFRQAVDYTQGRNVKNSRRARAMAKGTRYGRKEIEEAWQNSEVDALRRLAAAGVRVPVPYNFLDGVLLMELVTDAEFVCHVAAGYSGKPGELWYVRLLPPAFPEAANYHIVFTTPYILVKTSKDDWTQFLRRKTSQSNGVRNQDALHRFLKHGSTPNYWNEFVFQGYHHHQGNAIFLAGIPDLRTTLPHA